MKFFLVRVLLAILLVPAASVPGLTAELLKLATTTSTVSSGLLNKILPLFEASKTYEVSVIAVGTGKALRLGREGLVDVILVNAPLAELKFVVNGYGVNRRKVMQNDFLVVGPTSDPAGVNQMSDVVHGFKIIAQKEASFISRGDDSGTNKKELFIWAAAEIEPYGIWYREIGSGMADALKEASNSHSYILVDRGTWLALSDTTNLTIAIEGDNRLFNPYGVIAINPALHPDINYVGAMTFIKWITSPEIKKAIGDYRIKGEQLFVPNEGN